MSKERIEKALMQYAAYCSETKTCSACEYLDLCLNCILLPTTIVRNKEIFERVVKVLLKLEGEDDE